MEAAPGATRWTLMLTSIAEGSVPWRRYVLHPDQRVVFGCTAASDLVIDTPLMGSRHVTFWFEDGHWMAEDVGTTAGTYVDEARIDAPTPLPPGCTLRAGGVRFTITYRAPDEQPSLPRGATAAERPPEPTFPATPVFETYAVRLPDGAVWRVGHEEYVGFIEPMFPVARPFWPPGEGGEIDLREATRSQMIRMLESAEIEQHRTLLGPSPRPALMAELVRLLSADVRLLSYRSTRPRNVAEVNAERTRAEYAAVHFRAEVRMHREDRHFLPTPAIHVKLPRDLGTGCGSDCYFQGQKLDDMEHPSQTEVDRIAELLAGSVESHVVWALRGEGAAQWGSKFATEGSAGLPLVVKDFVARYRPSERVMNRLRLAIFVMSEALKRGIHFYGPADEFEYQNKTVWFHHFHDLAGDMPAY